MEPPVIELNNGVFGDTGGQCGNHAANAEVTVLAGLGCGRWTRQPSPGTAGTDLPERPAADFTGDVDRR
jgi:hypothetical protein